MESIGDKLRNKREESGISLDQVSRDTNIAKRYLEALETENFSLFPGEPYLVGFLRNYADYLGLNPDEVISLYKSFKIQEQPIPMDELLDTGRSTVWVKVLSGLLVLAVVVLAVVFWPSFGFGGSEPAVSDSSAEEECAVANPSEAAVSGETHSASQVQDNAEAVILGEERVEARFGVGTLFRIRQGETEHVLAIQDIGTSVRLSWDSGEYDLKLGEEASLDLDADTQPDAKVLLRDLDDGNALLRLSALLPEKAEEQPAESQPEVGEAQVASRKKNVRTILSAEDKAPVTLNLAFKGYCLFRYSIDGGEHVERYFHKDEVSRLEVTESIRLWVSNAGNTSIKVSGQDVVLGRPGEVATSLLKWERRGSLYELRLVPVY